MSRIYEALRRAGLDRKAQGEPDDEMLMLREGGVQENIKPSVMADLLTSEVARFQWKPSIDEIPCMLERGPIIEQFRGLRARMKDARHEHALKTLLVSSGIPTEGKSFVAMNLAISLIRHSVNRVLLIDADMRRPTLHKMLGTSSGPGLSEYLSGEKELFDVLQQTESQVGSENPIGQALSNLTFIPAGKCCDNSAELLTNGRLQRLISSLAPSFDWILIDSPPVLAITDAVEIARCTDAVLLVARHGVTPFDSLQRAQAALQKYRILGIVLNAAASVSGEDGYYNYYGAAEEELAPQKGKRGKI